MKRTLLIKKYFLDTGGMLIVKLFVILGSYIERIRTLYRTLECYAIAK